MGCEESFITMKPIWHDYLVLSLGNCVHETLTETGLIMYTYIDAVVRLLNFDDGHLPFCKLGV